MKTDHWQKIMDICRYCNVSFNDIIPCRRKHHSKTSMMAARMATLTYLKRSGMTHSQIESNIGILTDYYTSKKYRHLVEESKGLKKLIGI